MLDDLAVLEPEDVEPNLRTEEVVFGVRDDEVAILKRAHGVDACRALRQLLEQSTEPGQSVGDGEVVLDVLRRIDRSDGRGRARFDGLQKIDDLLFLG